MNIDEQHHVALPKLYGAPAYARPPRIFDESERPPDPDDLPLEVYRDEDWMTEASTYPGGVEMSRTAGSAPVAVADDDPAAIVAEEPVPAEAAAVEPRADEYDAVPPRADESDVAEHGVAEAGVAAGSDETAELEAPGAPAAGTDEAAEPSVRPRPFGVRAIRDFLHR